MGSLIRLKVWYGTESNTPALVEIIGYIIFRADAFYVCKVIAKTTIFLEIKEMSNWCTNNPYSLSPLHIWASTWDFGTYRVPLINALAAYSPELRTSYTMGCPSVREDNPLAAVASGLSYVQADNPWYNYFTPDIAQHGPSSSCLSW